MTDAIFARDENHSGGCIVCEIAGIVTGAGIDISMRNAESLSGGTDASDAAVVEDVSRPFTDLFKAKSELHVAGDVLATLLHLLGDHGQQGVVRVATVYAEHDLAGNGIT